MNLQRAADNAVETMLKQYGRDYNAHQAAAVLADNDGSLRAIVGGRDYGASQFNRATDAMRQPGSSFKPYVYSTALMAGMKPTSIVVDGPICVGNWCPKNYGGGFSGNVTMVSALTHSLNTVAVWLTRKAGNGSDKLGRQKVVETARRFGIKAPLPDTPSLPIGADEVNVLEHTVAYATFPNKGMAVTPHALLEVKSAAGETIWRFDRDGPKPRRAIPEQVAADMAFMMNKVVEEGTAKRAQLSGVKAAGKTGTTNAYRDAWFVGYTGNMVCGVWYGNDDYQPLNRMTGGALPAMTWHEIMAYAHQGIELKNIPGVAPNPSTTAPADIVAEGTPTGNDNLPRPALLTNRGTQTIQRIEHFMEGLANSMPANDRTSSIAPTPPPAGPIPNAIAAAEGNPRKPSARN
jgi:penicillin-binding protein 1A